MTTYIIRRLLLMIPTLVGVTAVVFFIMALAPGGFGGTVLGEHGAQTEGQDAKRIREYFNRRYGLDKPAIVQYGRWLNQVSPIGFQTTGKITFDQSERDAAIAILDGSELVQNIRRGKQTRTVALALARYRDIKPVEAAEQLIAALDDIDTGIAMLDSIDPVDAATADRLRALVDEDINQARRALLDELDPELSARDRILFHRPVVKWPNLGDSLRGRPVGELLREHVPITILLNVITIPIIYVVAILAGTYAARHRGKVFDIGSGFVLLAMWSLPVMWVGVMFIGFLANKQYVKLFPVGGLHDIQADAMAFLPRMTEAGFERGWLLDASWHLVLPVICLTYGGFAVLAKLTRTSILENISADYVRTARAKGVDDHTVLFRHVFRNSMLPLITVFVAILPGLFAGSVIVENIFSIQGMGKLGVDAAFMKDREVVMGTTLLGAVISLGALLVRDIWYAIADPRVSYE
jgi:peptide/nickel transport system permease protein